MIEFGSKSRYSTRKLHQLIFAKFTPFALFGISLNKNSVIHLNDRKMVEFANEERLYFVQNYSFVECNETAEATTVSLGNKSLNFAHIIYCVKCCFPLPPKAKCIAQLTLQKAVIIPCHNVTKLYAPRQLELHCNALSTHT